ncbi:MAG: hypothetical protein IMZ61_04630 [Planctomycetes bacterium]|nr:hypothetical protein [Planctomycetota bacterium]
MQSKTKGETLDCNKCSKKPTCIKLCKKAETYANQDWKERSPHEILMADLSQEQKAHYEST